MSEEQREALRSIPLISKLSELYTSRHAISLEILSTIEDLREVADAELRLEAKAQGVQLKLAVMPKTEVPVQIAEELEEAMQIPDGIKPRKKNGNAGAEAA